MSEIAEEKQCVKNIELKNFMVFKLNEGYFTRIC